MILVFICSFYFFGDVLPITMTIGNDRPEMYILVDI